MLLASVGCEPRPLEGPGLEPPKGRDDAGAADAEGNGRTPVVQRPGDVVGTPGGPITQPPNSGPTQPGVMLPQGGMSGSAAGGMAPTMAPPADGPDDSDDAGTEPGDTRDPWFTGLWVVEQNAIVDYQATLYELASNGALNERDYVSLRPPPHEGYETGSVAHPSGTARCTFGERWESEGLRRLRIEGQCSDGMPRTIVLVFPAGDAGDGLVPAIEEVAGEHDWQHPDRPWSFRKCESESPCIPF